MDLYDDKCSLIDSIYTRWKRPQAERSLRARAEYIPSQSGVTFL